MMMSSTVVRNRRFLAMQKLIEQGDYFSMEAMRCRQPLLYEQYCCDEILSTSFAAAATESERVTSDEQHRMPLTSMMLKQIDERIISERLNIQREIEESKSYDDDIRDYCVGDDVRGHELSLQEFRHVMQERFLCGLDEQFFDYLTVDTKETVDELIEMDRDAEESWFDAEPPSSTNELSMEQ